jgi:hypothetical protein
MEELKSKTENLAESISDYAETYFRLTVLKATDKATGIASGSLAAISVIFLSIFVLFFAGIATAIWLGMLMNNPIAGYFLVAAFFLLVMIILVLLRKRIIFPMIRNLIIRKIYE